MKNAWSSLGHFHVIPPKQRNFSRAKAVLHRLLHKPSIRFCSYDLFTTHISVNINLRWPHYERFPSWSMESAISPTENTLRLIEPWEVFLQYFLEGDKTPVDVGISFSGVGDGRGSVAGFISNKTA